MTKITVNFKEEPLKILNQLAKLNNCALSSVIEDLINESLIMREDVMSANIIKIREKEQDQAVLFNKDENNKDGNEKDGNNAKFKIYALLEVLNEDIAFLTKPMQQMVYENLGRLGGEPMTLGAIFNVDHRPFFRMKIGNCRVFYMVNLEKHKVTILAIKNRKDLFEEF